MPKCCQTGRILFLTLCCLLMPAIQGHSQTLEDRRQDTAEAIVQRFMSIVAYDALPHDSILFIRSHVVSRHAPHDTCVILRWFAWPHDRRIEVWQHDTLVEAYHNRGLTRFRKLDSQTHQWIDASHIHYDDMTIGYDYRGPLYNRHTNGCHMLFDGVYLFNGHPVKKISVSMPESYDREYLFEKESGLLFMVIEKNTSFGQDKMDEDRHIDWRAYDEYLPVGQSLIVSKECYQHHGTVTFVTHYPELIPLDKLIFENDQR
ncbi:MAG: hypothetical protein KBT04_04790 [Bacteroidales bacterium]|nr:hypothetical protein [Candidatus Colimorpha onthohippi]